MRKTSVILSVVALVLSLFSIYLAYINPEKDFSANLIATLGVLCTVLIGWQIFSFIDFRSYEKKLSDLEVRLMNDEKRILDTQKHIIESQKNFIALQEHLMGTYRSMGRGDGAVYDGISKIFRTLRNLDSTTPSFLLCQEIIWHIADFDVMLDTFSPMELRKILDNVRECINANIPLDTNHKKILLDQITHINEAFEKTSKSSDPEYRKVMDEALSLIHTICA